MIDRQSDMMLAQQASAPSPETFDFLVPQHDIIRKPVMLLGNNDIYWDSGGTADAALL